MENQKRITNIPNGILINLFGQFDANIKKIEQTFAVSIVLRGEDLLIAGESRGVEKAEAVFRQLTHFAEKGEEITEQKVNYLIDSVGDEEFAEIEQLVTDDFICMTVSGRPIKPKTVGQKKYIAQMRGNTVVFGVGPAGTGKTYLAMAMAITAFKRNEVNRIILTRPAIEAGEKLGFLPGDLQQKVDPYLRPLYDALHEIMGAEACQRNMEKGAIEVAPLAYMRGRTLDNAYIVLDEAQNTTPEQMKMFLTRIGFGSKTVITGDLTQIDLPDGKRSGLIEAVEILGDIPDIGISRLTNKDVVRHPLVQKIIKAYEAFENRAAYKANRGTRDRKAPFLPAKGLPVKGLLVKERRKISKGNG